MFFDFFANTLDLALGDYVSIAEQNDLVGDLIHLMQNVARDDDVQPLIAELLERASVSARAIGSSPFSGSSSTSTDGRCAMACASRMRCRMPLLYTGDFAVGGFQQD